MKTVGIFRNQLFKGSEVFIDQQAEALTHFYKCYIGRRVVGHAPENANAHVLNEKGTLHERICEGYNALTLSAMPYKHLLRCQRLDLIHAHFAIDGLYALALAKSKDVPLVTTLHGFDVTVTSKELLASRSPAWINYLLRQRQLKEEGDKFICVSNFIARQAIENGFPDSKIIQHYIGIDVDKYSCRDSDEDQSLILHVARLVEKKGTSVLLDAIAIVRKGNPNVKLLIIGDGPLKAQLKEKVSALGLDENVILAGALPHLEVMQWMRKAGMLVLPSLTAKTGDAEGLGMVLLEAAATGVPVIGSQHGGIPEAIIDEKTGYLVPEKDPQQLAERISWLLNNADIRHQMGIEARQFVAMKFNLSKQTKKLEAIYQEVIHG